MNTDHIGDPVVQQMVGEDDYIARLLEVEIALAGVEGNLGIIPSTAAERIAQIRLSDIRRPALAKGIANSGFPVIALVQEIRRNAGPDAAAYVHWGATTQDVMDTAFILQVRSVCELYRDRLHRLTANLSELCHRGRATVMAGRTHGQQALPVSFGLKVAGWLIPLVRHVKRLDEVLDRLLVVQFGGAAGTLAALDNRGLEVAQALANALGLGMPASPWHTQRDNLAEFAGWLSLVTGSLGKMAQDVILMAQTEVGELAETAEPGRGGSSTMPQKANPITSELILAAARTNATLISAMHHALIQEHERATHGWQVEWLTAPQMMILTGGALQNAIALSTSLQMNPQAMGANIARGNDLILAEAAVFRLAKTMPRESAETLVKMACGIAIKEGKSLGQVLRELKPDADLPRPEEYLGESDRIIDAVLIEASNCQNRQSGKGNGRI